MQVISFVIIFRNHFFPILLFSRNAGMGRRWRRAGIKRASEEVTSPLKSVALIPARRRRRPMPHQARLLFNVTS